MKEGKRERKSKKERIKEKEKERERYGRQLPLGIVDILGLRLTLKEKKTNFPPTPFLSPKKGSQVQKAQYH